MAAVRFPCPLCDQNIKAPLGQAGEPFVCPRCGGAITAPSNAEPQSSVAAGKSLDEDFDSLFWDAKKPSAAPVEPAAPAVKEPVRQTPVQPPPVSSPPVSSPPRENPSKGVPPSKGNPPTVRPADSGRPQTGSSPHPSPPLPAAPNPPAADASEPPKNPRESAGNAGNVKQPVLPRPRTSLPSAPGRVVKSESSRESNAPVTPPKEKKKKRKAPKFRISCTLCGTRIDVSVRQVGDKVKCPDCHSMVLVKAPPGMLQDKSAPKPRKDDDEDILGVAPAPERTAFNVAKDMMEQAQRENPRQSAPSTREEETSSQGASNVTAASDVNTPGVTTKEPGAVESEAAPVLTSPANGPPESSPNRSAEASQADRAQDLGDKFGFECSLCGTRLEASSAGEMIPCPDCLSDNIAPQRVSNPPERTKTNAAKTDAERDGANTTGSASASRDASLNRPPVSAQSKRSGNKAVRYGFECSICSTRLHARSAGETIVCPDCLSDNLSPEPPPGLVSAETDAALESSNESNDDEFRLEATVDRPTYEPIEIKGAYTLEQVEAAGPEPQDAPPKTRSSSAPNAERTKSLSTFTFVCPTCAEGVVVTDNQLGIRYTCGKCNKTATISRPASNSSPASIATPTAPTAPPSSHKPQAASPPAAPPRPPSPPVAVAGKAAGIGAAPPAPPAYPTPTPVPPPQAVAKPQSPIFTGSGDDARPMDKAEKEQVKETLREAEKSIDEKKKHDDAESGLLEQNYIRQLCGFMYQDGAMLQWLTATMAMSAAYAATIFAGGLLGSGGAMAVLGLLVGVFALVLLCLSGVLVSGMIRAILCDTASGNPYVQSWSDITELPDQFPTFCTIGVAGLYANSIGGIIASTMSSLGMPIWLGACLVMPGQFLLYPFLLLSLLESDSIFVPASKEVLNGLLRFPMMWAQFYGESFVILLAAFAAVWLLMISYYMIPVVAALHALLLFIFHRALGRLSYRIALGNAEVDSALATKSA